MRKTLLATFTAVSAAALLSGCNGGGASSVTPRPPVEVATITVGEEAKLFPLVVGNQWVYESSTTIQSQAGSQTEENELTFVVRTVNQQGDATRAVIDIKAGEELRDSTGWVVNQRGIHQSSARNLEAAFNPPQLLLPFPYEQGRTFEFSGTGPFPFEGSGQFRSSGTVVGPQEVDTGMGPKSAIAVDGRTSWRGRDAAGGTTDQTATSTTWWAPGIGLVRFVQDITGPGYRIRQVLRLKSHSLKE